MGSLRKWGLASGKAAILAWHEAMLDDIRAAGFIPGLWIAPFMVGNRSQLFRTNPIGWFRIEPLESRLLQWKHYGEYRWHKRSEEYYILDTTHPEAFEYLRTVFEPGARNGDVSTLRPIL